MIKDIAAVVILSVGFALGLFLMVFMAIHSPYVLLAIFGSVGAGVAFVVGTVWALDRLGKKR